MKMLSVHPNRRKCRVLTSSSLKSVESSVFKIIFVHTRMRGRGVFKFPPLEERFRKALRFDDGLVWTVGLW